MTSLVVLGAAGAPLIAVLTAALLALRTRLAATLAELCGDHDRGIFWTRMCQVAMVAGTALVATGGAAVSPGAATWERVAGLWRWGLIGLLASVAVVAAVVAQFTVRLAAQPPPSRGAGNPPPSSR